MKKLLSILMLTVACTTGYSQTTNDSPIFGFLQQSNLVGVVYGIYDSTDGSVGAGMGLAYKASEFVVPVLRLDFIKGDVYIPSGNLTLQYPVTVRGLPVVPFLSGGIATALNHTDDSEPIGIVGSGFYVELPDSLPAWVPDIALFAYERWEGGGFSDNQWRLGVGWGF